MLPQDLSPSVSLPTWPLFRIGVTVMESEFGVLSMLCLLHPVIRFSVKQESPASEGDTQCCTPLFVQRLGRLFRAVQASGASAHR